LEQYFWFFVDHRQKDWPEWLVMTKFAVNKKTHLITKVFLFIANYRRELRMGADIKKKGKSRESDRVCRKNKESTEGSRGSIEKSPGRDKKISR